MNLIIKLTVLFENPFWIGIFELMDGDYRVCKVTFGSEPKEQEVYEFILKNFYNIRFSEGSINESRNLNERKNPKRVQREIRKETLNQGIGTKAQNAIKEQFEEIKTLKKHKKKERKEEEMERKFLLKKKKKLEKHKGH